MNKVLEKIGNEDKIIDVKERKIVCSMVYLKYFLLGIFALGILSLFGFKYKLVASNGEIYRINQITGQVQLIKGTRFVAVDRIIDVQKSNYGQLRHWDVISIKNNHIDVDLKTVWRNGRLYYNVDLSPFETELKKVYQGYDRIYNRITIQFLDENGFLIKEIDVPFSNMAQMTDAENKTKSLQASGSVELAYEDMKLIKNWNCMWNF